MRNKPGYIVGVDEAGRGPLAGPVVAAAVTLNPGIELKGLKDSKQLSPKKRQVLFRQIVDKSFQIGVGIISHKLIDRFNIHKATLLAMKEAVNNLPQKPKKVLIDGIHKIPGVQSPQKTIIKGDTKIKSISAASIVAKVVRDRIMEQLHLHYPLYEFAKHKGYGTKLHMERIEKYGICPYHRRSFHPVSSFFD